MTTWDQHVHPHGPLVAHGSRLWTVQGKLPRGEMPRTMVVHKLATGGLLIHSAIALDAAGMRALAALGEPEVLVVPCALHRLDAGVWKERFPRLRVLAPQAAREAAAKVVAVDGVCEDELPKRGVPCHRPDGLKPFELWYEMDTGSGKALVLTDSLMNMKHLPGFGGWLFKALGSTGFFGITRIGRLFLLKDRALYRAFLERMAALPGLAAVIVAHGDPVTRDAAARLREAAARV